MVYIIRRGTLRVFWVKDTARRQLVWEHPGVRTESCGLLMISKNHEKDLISLPETLNDTNESQWVMKQLSLSPFIAWPQRNNCLSALKDANVFIFMAYSPFLRCSSNHNAFLPFSTIKRCYYHVKRFPSWCKGCHECHIRSFFYKQPESAIWFTVKR